MTYIAHVVTGVCSGEVSTCDVCVLFPSSRSGLVFHPSAGAIIDHNQSVKDIDPHFKSRLYVEDPGNRKPVLILPIGVRRAC